MCTAMSLISKKEVIFGRTMDFSYDLDPSIYVVPKNFKWSDLNNNIVCNKYRFIGTGQHISHLVFADGMNDQGLGVAALYFQGYAHFDKEVNVKKAIGSIDIVGYILGNCSNIEEVIYSLNNIDIVGIQDTITNIVAPLHWFIVDKSGKSITVEKTINGLQIFDNKIGVLTNAPDFQWQMTNLNNYLNLNPEQSKEEKWNEILLRPFGQGAKTFGLPGDYTSPSRFVKTSFQKNFVIIPDDQNQIINTAFNVVKGVMIPKGIVITNIKTADYTQYTVFMNLKNGDYYFNTHDNNQILKVNINEKLSSDIVSLGKLKSKVQFNKK